MGHDTRKYKNQTNLQLIIGGILILFIIGGGLIFLIYGQNAGSMAIICLVAGMVPLLSIFLFLRLIEWIAKKSNDRS